MDFTSRPNDLSGTSFKMYREFYGFREVPFSLIIDKQFFYSSEPHARVLDTLRQGINEHDFLNAWIADQCSLGLPFYPSMNSNEFEYLANAILNYKF